MLKVYLAAQYAKKDLMNAYAEELRAEGIEVTSRWLQETHDLKIPLNSSELTDAEKTEYAIQDLEDIIDSDWIVFFAESHDKQPPRGGRHFELGFAYGKLGTQCMVVGERENIFHYLDDIVIASDWNTAKQALIESNSYMEGNL